MKLGELLSQLINVLEDYGADVPVSVEFNGEDCPMDSINCEQMVNGQWVVFIKGQT